MRKVDVCFSLNLLLNLLSPSSFAKTGSNIGGKETHTSLRAAAAAVQYNPAGDVTRKVKSSSMDIAFLGNIILHAVLSEFKIFTSYF